MSLKIFPIYSGYCLKIIQLCLLNTGILISTVPSFAQINVPKYSNEFLSIGVGARGLAMGKAITASSSDATSIFWNPSGMVDLTSDYSGSLMHNEYFGGIATYDYLGLSIKVDSVSNIGIGLIRFGIDDIPDTRFLYDANGQINYDNVRFFSAADYGLFLSYARRISKIDGLSIGGNFKVIHRNAGNFASAWGFGLDASARFVFNPKMHFAVTARDISTTFNAWSHSTSLLTTVYSQTGNSIPESSLELTLPSITFGMAYKPIMRDNFEFLTTFDLGFNFDGERASLINTGIMAVNPSIGIELNYKNKLYLRGGLSQFQYRKELIEGGKGVFYEPGIGAGFAIDRFSVDYALTNQISIETSLYSHVFSLNINIDKE